jgi:hypothetical protein
MILFDAINCLCCGKSVKLLDSNLDDYVEHAKKLNKDPDPASWMWDGGAVQKVSAGYGSTNDGDQFYVAVCDACIDLNYKNGRLIYDKDYLFSYSKFTEDELKEFEKRRRRESNLNKLI